MSNYGGLYTGLLPIALGVVSKAVHGVDFYEIREIAHDITTDFIMFSRSFKETYDSSRGSIEAFFSSYVWKKCYRVREQIAKERSTKVELDGKVHNTEAVKDFFVEWEEAMSQLNFYYSVLKGEIVSGIDLGDLLKHLILFVLREGKVVKYKLANEMGTSRESIRLALKALRKKLSLICS